MRRIDLRQVVPILTNIRVIAGVGFVGGLLLLLASADTNAQIGYADGQDGELTEEGLRQIDPKVLQGAWVRPGIDLAHFESILLLPPKIQLRDLRELYAAIRSEDPAPEYLNEEALTRQISTPFNEAILTRFEQIDSFDLVEDVGRDVLLIRSLMAEVAFVYPSRDVGSLHVFSESGGAWSSAIIVLEVRDSMSDNLLARVIRKAGTSESIYAGGERAFTQREARRWAALAGQLFDELIEATREK